MLSYSKTTSVVLGKNTRTRAMHVYRARASNRLLVLLAPIMEPNILEVAPSRTVMTYATVQVRFDLFRDDKTKNTHFFLILPEDSFQKIIICVIFSMLCAY